MEYFSVLVNDDEEEKYHRQDFCSVCWGHEAFKQAKSFWKGRVPLQKELLKPPELNKEGLLTWLRELLAEERAEAATEAFVLALFLARRRQVVLRKELERQGQLFFIYEDPETEELFSVRKVPLTPEQLLAMQASLEQRFVVKKSL